MKKYANGLQPGTSEEENHSSAGTHGRNTTYSIATLYVVAILLLSVTAFSGVGVAATGVGNVSVAANQETHGYVQVSTSEAVDISFTANDISDDGAEDTIRVVFPSDVTVNTISTASVSDSGGTIPLTASEIVSDGSGTDNAIRLRFTDDNDAENSYHVDIEAQITVASGGSVPISADVIDSGGSNVEDASLGSLTADGTTPSIQSATVLDTDDDGSIDTANVVFNEPIDDSTFMSDPDDWDIIGIPAASISTKTYDDSGNAVDTDVDDNKISFKTAWQVGGTDGERLPISYTPDSSADARDLAGNKLPQSDIGSPESGKPVYDGAAPVIGSSDYTDTDLDGEIDQVDIQFSESIGSSSLELGDFDVSGNSLSATGVELIDADTVRLSLTGSTASTHVGSLSIHYDQSAGTANSLSDGTNPVSSFTNTPDDNARPLIESHYSFDVDGDGLVDEVAIQFTEDLDTTRYSFEGQVSLRDDFTVNGKIPTSVDLATNPNDGNITQNSVDPGVDGDEWITLFANKTAVSDTTPVSVTYTDPGDGAILTDDNSNALVGTASAGLTPEQHDRAAPIALSAEYTDADQDGTVDTIDIVFSEDISASSPETGDFSFAGGDTGDINAQSAIVPTGKSDTVRLAVESKSSDTDLGAVSTTYIASDGSPGSVTDGSAPVQDFSSLSVDDAAGPAIASVSTSGSPSDGVTALDVTMTEQIDDSASTFTGAFSLGTGSISKISTGDTSDDAVVVVAVNGISDSDATPTVTLRSSKIRDMSGNTISADHSITASDGIEENTGSSGGDNSDEDDDQDGSTNPVDPGSGTDGTSSTESSNETDTTTNTSVSTTVSNNGTTVAEIGSAERNESVIINLNSTIPLSKNGTENRTNPADSVSTVTNITLSMSQDADNLSLSVSTSSTPPNQTEPLDEGTGLGYLEIELQNASDTDIDQALVTFNVTDNSVDPDSVLLYRYHNGTWENLDTQYMGNGTYRANTPGFSVFAIGRSEPQSAQDDNMTTPGPTQNSTATPSTQPNTPTTDDTPEQTSNTRNTETTSANSPGFTAVLGVLAVLVASLIAYRRR